ncbi:signal peptidase II [Nakamurella alba]|uniref:signal peptidase II n=1 Tax=Nakamurella alba TaxID=2665158 RepID=UPI002AC32BBC|nr:signal peptidase II [Nakamurella alba]
MTDTGGPAPDSTDSDVPAPAQPPRRIGILAALALLVVVLDQIVKVIVVANLEPGVPHRALGGLVYFTLIRNPGAAFGLADSMTWLLSLIVIAVIVWIIRIAGRLRSTIWAVSLGLILGGAVGNLIDRIFRAPGFLRGHVVDYISLFETAGQHFAIFNLADMGITFGGVILVLAALLGVEVDGRRTKDVERERAEQKSAEQKKDEQADG